jgi:predicted Zn-dependent protease with MMP-like domain
VVGNIARIVEEERDYDAISRVSHEFLNQLGDNLQRINNLARTGVIDAGEADEIVSYVGLLDGKTLHSLLWMKHGQLPNIPEIFQHKSWIKKLLAM